MGVCYKEAIQQYDIIPLVVGLGRKQTW